MENPNPNNEISTFGQMDTFSLGTKIWGRMTFGQIGISNFI